MMTSGKGAVGRIPSGRVVGVILFILAALCPVLLDDYKTGLIGLGLTYGLFAIGLDIAWGRAGLVSIGQAVFFGLGCYGVAVAAVADKSMLLGAVVGILIATV